MRSRLLSFPAAFLDLLHGNTISTVKTKRYEQSRAEKDYHALLQYLTHATESLRLKEPWLYAVEIISSSPNTFSCADITTLIFIMIL
jgi:hypothetical protein